MHPQHYIFMISFAVVTAASCRPASQDNFLYENAAEQVQINVTEQKRQITFKGPTGKKITNVKQLSISKDQPGKFTPASGKKYVSLTTSGEKTLYDIELVISTDTSCKNSTAAGVPLHNASSFSISCVNENVLTAQLKSTCNDLATDPTIAEYDETKDACTCLKRSPDKLLKYSDYFGKVSAFKIECANTATREQLKSICTEIKDKQCPTCTVGALSCECKKSVILVFDDYLETVDSFRNKCEDPKFIKPVTTETPAQLLEKFEAECKKTGTLSTASSTEKSCLCANGLAVGLDEWKKDKDAISITCKGILEPEAGSKAVSEFEKACTANNGSFDLNEPNNDDSVCTCKYAGSPSDKAVAMKDFQTIGSDAFKDLCALKPTP